MKIDPRLVIPIILMSVIACAKTATDTEIRIEGQQAGDCTDRADNDADGDFDCDDSGCANSPDCQDEATDSSDASDMGEPSDGDDPVESTCGDGILQDGETCDDGNSLSEPCAYGESACTICNEKCQLRAGIPQYCGDGVVQSNYESCDEDLRVDYDCPYGERECTFCNADCELKPGNVSFCGDGIIDGAHNETCDDGNAEREECEVPEEGCVICNENCEQETIAPTVCVEEQVGDFCFEGVANVPEWPEEVWGLESVDEVTDYPYGCEIDIDVTYPGSLHLVYMPYVANDAAHLKRREGEWSDAQTIVDLDWSSTPSLAVDSNDIAHVLVDGENGFQSTLHYYRSDTGEAQPIAVNDPAGDLQSVDMWMSPCGEVMALHKFNSTTSWGAAIGTLRGDTWTYDWRAVEAERCDECNRVAVDPSGNRWGTYQGTGNNLMYFSVCDVDSPHEIISELTQATAFEFSSSGIPTMALTTGRDLRLVERLENTWQPTVLRDRTYSWTTMPGLSFTSSDEPIVFYGGYDAAADYPGLSNYTEAMVGYYIRDGNQWNHVELARWDVELQVSPCIGVRQDSVGNTHILLSSADGKLRYIKTRFE